MVAVWHANHAAGLLGSWHWWLSANFVAQVMDTLHRTGANPERLKLEVTESILVSNVEEVISTMAALKAIGVTFSLDDFGTGYSSLGYLSRLPIDQLKIDRTFVANMASSANAVSICVAVISLARSLNLNVVAEGVETEAQFQMLTCVHGCEYVQGYLIGHPLIATEFEALLNQRTTGAGPNPDSEALAIATSCLYGPGLLDDQRRINYQ